MEHDSLKKPSKYPRTKAQGKQGDTSLLNLIVLFRLLKNNKQSKIKIVS